MDRGALIRTFQAADLGFILHSRHQYHWHTGLHPAADRWRCRTSARWSRRRSARRIRQCPRSSPSGRTWRSAAESAALKSFHTAGFLGTEYGPFLITDPQDAASAVRPPAELGDARFRSRRKLYEQLLANEPVYEYWRRLSARIADAVAGRGRPAAHVAVGQGVRPVARAEEELRHLQHRPLRAGLPAGAAAGGSRRALRRGDHRVHPVPLLGFARERPRARGR